MTEGKIYILLLLFLIVCSCKKAAVFEDYQSIKNEEWCREKVIEFKADIPEAGRYMVYLCLRHTTDYEMTNLWCFVNTRSSAEKQLKDTVNINIIEPNGHWTGKGSGKIKTLEQALPTKLVSLPKGIVLFRIEQGMTQECLKGIKDVGLKIQTIK